MGKRRSWFSAMKKALICESRETRQKKNRKSGRCFGKQRSINLDSSSKAENALVAPSAHAPLEDQVKLIEAENQQNRHAYSVALVTAMAAEAAVAAANAAAEVVRLRASAYKTKEEIAVIKIQTAFRGYMARRVLSALRGVRRLKSVMGGKSVERQAASTLKCMQTLAHVQLEIRARRIRMSEANSAIQQQIQRKHDKELLKSGVSIGENWDKSTRSKEQMEANIQNRHEAALRRERALAYAHSHQQTLRNSSNSANQTFLDPNNPRWGWSWLERWMAARPWENGNAVNNGPVSSKTTSTHSNTKIQSPTAEKRRQSPSTPKPRQAGKIKPMSPRGTVGTNEDSRSMNSAQSDRCRRHSITGLSVRDDESFASSQAIPSYMASTESARAKSRLPSPQGSEKLGMTPKRLSAGSDVKRLSFSGSPARHCGPAKTGDVLGKAH